MEIIDKSLPLSKVFNAIIDNITYSTPFQILRTHIIKISPTHHKSKQKQASQTKQQRFSIQHQQKYESVSKDEHSQEKLENQLEFPEANTDKKQEVELEQAIKTQLNAEKQHLGSEKHNKFIPLETPSANPKRPIYQYSHLKDQSAGHKQNNHQRSEESLINLQLTANTKQNHNLSYTLGKQQSLIYSDATLVQSKATGFCVETSQKNIQQRAHRSQSHKSALRQIQDGDQQQTSARMERSMTRQVQRRNDTDEITSFKEIEVKLKNERNQTQAIFQTEVSDKRNKIARIRQIKEKKRRQLQNELNKVSRQIDELTRKESETHPPKNNNFQSRVKIADNPAAQVNAERLVRGLQKQKRARHQAHLDDLEVIDKNIHNFMEELMRQRYKNEEKIKQKKKLKIIERMKLQEMRKVEQQKQQHHSLQFVAKLKANSSKPQIQNRAPEYPQSSKQHIIKRNQLPIKQRTPTKVSQGLQETEITPQLTRKKAYLRKIRNISFKKRQPDAYQQLLM